MLLGPVPTAPIPGYEGLYEVDAGGNVWSLHSTRVLLRPRVSARGYLSVGLTLRGAKTNYLVHRLVLWAFVGPPPEGTQGCHNDGDKLNNSRSNLRWDSISANVRDQVAHGVHNMASKTHCKHGHAFDEANTYVTSYGSRQCRPCGARRHRERSVRQVAELTTEAAS